MTVSRWERGQLAPTARHYIGLGNISGRPSCWYFWERAGLQTSDVLRSMSNGERKKLPVNALPALEHATAGPGTKTATRIKTEPDKLVAIPLLKTSVGTPGHAGDKKLSLSHSPAERMIGAPPEWCPNPAYTSLVRVKGHSMEPMIHDGDIVAVDSFQTDLDQLDGKIVVVSSEQKGLCISHFRRYELVDILEPDNRKEYSATVYDRKSGARIIGRVLWWITEAP